MSEKLFAFLKNPLGLRLEWRKRRYVLFTLIFIAISFYANWIGDFESAFFATAGGLLTFFGYQGVMKNIWWMKIFLIYIISGFCFALPISTISYFLLPPPATPQTSIIIGFTIWWAIMFLGVEAKEK